MLRHLGRGCGDKGTILRAVWARNSKSGLIWSGLLWSRTLEAMVVTAHEIESRCNQLNFLL